MWRGIQSMDLNTTLNFSCPCTGVWRSGFSGLCCPIQPNCNSWMNMNVNVRKPPNAITNVSAVKKKSVTLGELSREQIFLISLTSEIARSFCLDMTARHNRLCVLFQGRNQTGPWLGCADLQAYEISSLINHHVALQIPDLKLPKGSFIFFLLTPHVVPLQILEVMIISREFAMHAPTREAMRNTPINRQAQSTSHRTGQQRSFGSYILLLIVVVLHFFIFAVI